MSAEQLERPSLRPEAYTGELSSPETKEFAVASFSPESVASDRQSMLVQARESVDQAHKYEAVGVKANEVSDPTPNYLDRLYPQLAAIARESDISLPFETELKLGAFRFRTPEAEERFRTALDLEVKAILTVLASKFGMDIATFPLEKLTVLAPDKEESSVRGVMATRNMLHRRRLAKNNFYHTKTKNISNTAGLAHRYGLLANKDAITMPLEGSPLHVDPFVLTHELMHKVAKQQKMETNRKDYKDYSAFIDEGIVGVAELYMQELLGGEKLPAFEGQLPWTEQHKRYPGEVEFIDRAYSNENRVLHAYLYEEKGGAEALSRLARGRKNLKDNLSLSKVYSSTYGNSLEELLDEAKVWHQNRQLTD